MYNTLRTKRFIRLACVSWREEKERELILDSNVMNLMFYINGTLMRLYWENLRDFTLIFHKINFVSVIQKSNY